MDVNDIRRFGRELSRRERPRVTDYTEEVVEARDKEIRLNNFYTDYLTPLDQITHEVDLHKYILHHQPTLAIYQDYPYIIEYEYQVNPPFSQDGSGDMIFTDKKGNFLIVELKFLTPRMGKTANKLRQTHRRKVEEQAFEYGTIFKTMFPAGNVKAIAGTNQDFWHRIYEI